MQPNVRKKNQSFNIINEFYWDLGLGGIMKDKC